MRKDRLPTLIEWAIIIPFCLLVLSGIIFSLHKIIYREWDTWGNFIVPITLLFVIFMLLVITSYYLEEYFPNSKIAQKIKKGLDKLRDLLTNARIP